MSKFGQTTFPLTNRAWRCGGIHSFVSPELLLKNVYEIMFISAAYCIQSAGTENEQPTKKLTLRYVCCHSAKRHVSGWRVHYVIQKAFYKGN